MKKLYVVLLFSYLVLAPMFSQAIQYEIKTKYNQSATAVTANITVTVKEGESGFTYYLMTNDPMNGDVLMQSRGKRRKNLCFQGCKARKIFCQNSEYPGIACRQDR